MNKIVHIIAATLMTVLLVGCASSGPPQPAPRLDMAEIRHMLDCPLDTSPVCTERIGQPYHCFCADRDALQRILEPDKY